MDRQFAVEFFPSRVEGWVILSAPFSSREDAEKVLSLCERINPQFEHRVYEITNDPKRRKEG